MRRGEASGAGSAIAVKKLEMIGKAHAGAYCVTLRIVSTSLTQIVHFSLRSIQPESH
jgi:hypothetical protein